MKLYIKQHIFTMRDRFTIKDSKGKNRYYVKGKLISLTKKLRIYDRNNRKVAEIREGFFSLTSRSQVFVDDRYLCTIRKKINPLANNYEIPELAWKIKGNIFAHNYNIYDENNRQIANISKAWISVSDRYELNIIDESREVELLALVLAIDIALYRKKKSAIVTNSSNMNNSNNM